MPPRLRSHTPQKGAEPEFVSLPQSPVRRIRKAVKIVAKKPRRSRALSFLLSAALLLSSCVYAARVAGTAYCQSLMAWFEPGEALPVDAATAALHASLFVADLHCDATWVPRSVWRCVSDARCFVSRSVAAATCCAAPTRRCAACGAASAPTWTCRA